MNDLILAYCSGYDLPQVEPFLASWQKSCRNATLVLFENDLTSPLRRRLDEIGVVRVPMKKSIFRRTHPMVGRFEHYLDFLNQQRDEDSRVLLTDLRDVVFQSDPFAPDLPNEVVFAAEDGLIGDCRFHRKWLSDCFGGRTFELLGRHPITCAGTTLGSLGGIKNYIRLLLDLFDEYGIDRSRNYDQGVHNFILWALRPEWISFDCDRDFFATVGTVPAADLAWTDDRIAVRKKISPIVHQWDRHGSLQAAIESRPEFKLASDAV